MNSNEVFARIELISKTSGAKAKKELLENDRLLKQVIHYAYDPFKTYNIKQLDFVGKGTRTIEEPHFQFLGLLADRVYTGHDAINRVRIAIEGLSEPSAQLYSRIIKKDLRCGLNVKSFNDVYPGLVPYFGVMLAKAVDWDKLIFPCYSSIKLDGIRGYFSRGRFFTRTGKPIIGLSHLEKQLEGYPDLDGELTVRDKDFNTGSGLIRSLAEVPNAYFNTIDLPVDGASFPQRLNKLKELATLNSFPIQHVVVANKHDAMDHYRQCKIAGFEGTVLKPLNYPYVRTRSNKWMKIKSVETIDLKVVGYYEGEGKYEGMLGGLWVDYKGKRVGVGGGVSDVEREGFWINRRALLGQTMELLYMEETPAGSLRHTRFVRMRFDK